MTAQVMIFGLGTAPFMRVIVIQAPVVKRHRPASLTTARYTAPGMDDAIHDSILTTF
jgi:hypothetical protein